LLVSVRQGRCSVVHADNFWIAFEHRAGDLIGAWAFHYLSAIR